MVNAGDLYRTLYGNVDIGAGKSRHFNPSTAPAVLDQYCLLSTFSFRRQAPRVQSSIIQPFACSRSLVLARIGWRERFVSETGTA